jgi:hypothetical protein
MKKFTRQTIAVGILLLTTAGLARANGNEDNSRACSASTLHGQYAFTASGFDIVGGVAQPKAIVELIRFNGDGTLVVPAATHSINGVVARSPANGTGTYVVAPDCTGTLAFGPPGPTFDVFLAPDGSEVDMIQTSPGSPVLQGTAVRRGR